METIQWNLLFTGYAAVAAALFGLWLLQLKTQRATVVDVAWSGALAALAVYYAIFADGVLWQRLLAGLMGGVWGGRLAYFLIVDRVVGKNEDGRYDALRKHWGPKANFNFFFFYQAQGLLAAVLSLSFLIPASDASAVFNIWDALGISVWLLSVIGETIADKQLAGFRNNPANRGKTCRVGLWNYSRHPNYFFEWLHWWSYTAITVGSPHGFLTFLSPLLMYFFITKFTGVPYTEIQAVKSRGEDYLEYQRTTSVLVPWFPKK